MADKPPNKKPAESGADDSSVTVLASQSASKGAEFSQQQIPASLPALPLSDLVIFPFMVAPLLVSSQSSISLVDDVVAGNRLLVLVLQKNPDIENPGADDLHEYGCVGKVLKMLKFPDESVRILVQGLKRAKIVHIDKNEPYLVAGIAVLEEQVEKSLEMDALARNAANQFQEVVSLTPSLPDELKIAAVNLDDPSKLSDLIASNLNIALNEKQKLLENADVKARLGKLTSLLNRELEVLHLGSEIQTKVSSAVSKNQRDFYLREQMKAIQKELGEGSEQEVEAKELREKIEKAKMPEEARKVALKEADRLATIPSVSAEYTVVRTYLDWLVALPWSKATEDKLDIRRARQILDEDHYDLDKVKERILEYLSVLKLKNDMKGPILCFVGPPGVGKTSLGRSIARALNRKFHRISLGGVRDEAEIRGHRRTYIGALPGRIIQGLRKVEVNNPVFMLDEVDKLGADFRGDPSAALLEVLDPAQNNSFSDHYLEVTFDLSHVMFLLTANVMDTVPPALRDRMEVLELPGYTTEEKVFIARNYLVPQQTREHGLKESQIVFQPEAIQKIIGDYTREAGVRNLEREVAAICRKVARQLVEGKAGKGRIQIAPKDVRELLGTERFFYEAAERTSATGVATGLAWTPTGGDILFIEATAMPGKGNLILTGSLGNVMRESAQAALSFIRARGERIGVSTRNFDQLDVHIHVPAGAIPKDGPSAGVTIAAALASLFTKRPVRSDVAMTGEITLRGKVLPVGGVKEKVLAAARSGIHTIILPKRNEKDLEDIPKDVRRKMKFHPVEDITATLKLALLKNAAAKNT
jgi:ATP-dependent Lon protease